MNPAAWRPYNESPEDREREEMARRALAERWHCSVVKLSEQLYGIDWMLHDRRAVLGLGEFKFRERKYDTLHISLAKLMRGLGLAKIAQCPFYVFVKWDGLPFSYLRLEHDVTLSACVIYNNRGQNGDLEPGIALDSATFLPVTKEN